jgi:hypothetical protein
VTQRASWPPEKLRELARSEAFPPLTVVGPALGYGKTGTYDAVRRGDFPLEVIRFSPRRWCVRGTDLLRLVDGESNPTPNSAEGGRPIPPSAEPSRRSREDGNNQGNRFPRAI